MVVAGMVSQAAMGDSAAATVTQVGTGTTAVAIEDSAAVMGTSRAGMDSSVVMATTGATGAPQASSTVTPGDSTATLGAITLGGTIAIPGRVMTILSDVTLRTLGGTTAMAIEAMRENSREPVDDLVRVPRG